MQPTSSPRNETTASVRSCRPIRSTASSAGDDAERAVEAAALRDRVEVGARPELRQLGPGPAQPPEQVAGRVALDLQAGFLEPAGRELVRQVLAGRARGAVRPGPPPIA